MPGNPEDAPAGRADSGRADPVRPPRCCRCTTRRSPFGAATSFGAVRAVVDGSADLCPGEAHALLGENGAGKSTVVKLLAGVLTAGELSLGHRIAHPGGRGGGGRVLAMTAVAAVDLGAYPRAWAAAAQRS